MEIEKTQTTEGNDEKLLEENMPNINDAVDSLSEAVSVLRSLKNRGDLDTYQAEVKSEFPKSGVDFYEATKKYEINLIKRALAKTRGHQTKAAKLLNLKLSTLNAIIKRHNINFLD